MLNLKQTCHIIGYGIIGLMLGFFLAHSLSFTLTEGITLTLLGGLCGGLVAYRLWE